MGEVVEAPSDSDMQDVELALLSLGAASPDRFARLVAVLPSPWSEVGAKAQALLQQLKEPHLPPELARIRDELAAQNPES